MPLLNKPGLKVLMLTICLLLVFPFICQGLIFVSPRPSKVRVNVAAGKSASGEIEVYNPTADSILAVRAYVQDFIMDEKGSIKYFPRGSQKNSCSTWLEINPENLMLQPKSTGKLSYVLRPPASAKGTYYAVIFFENFDPEIKKQQKGVGIRVSARIGSHIIAMITGTIKRSFSDIGVEIEPPKKNKPMLLTYSLKNTGNVDIEANGDYNILDDKGNFFGRGKYKFGRAMPAGEIKKTSEYLGDLPEGNYTVVSTFNIGPDEPLDTVVKETTFKVTP